MGMNDMLQFFRQISGRLNSNVYAGLQGVSSPQQLAFVRELQKEMKQKSSLETPLNELQVVVFDIETTGFYPDKGDQIISIGAVKMTGQQIQESDTFYSLIKTDIALSEEIAALTNIRDEDLQTAPPASEVLVQFFKFIKSDVLVAHHAKHEQAFMQKMTTDLFKTRFEHRIIDTSFLIRIANPSTKAQTLEDVCHECSIEVLNRHHALGDAQMTAKIWSYYLKRAEEKGYKTLREVYEHLNTLG